MKNYFGLSMLIWCVAFALALLIAWPIILQNMLLLTNVSVDKRLLIGVFYILFNPSANLLIWLVWFSAGFIGGILIKGVKSGALLSTFSVSVLFVIFELLVFQIQAVIYTFFEFILSPIWLLSVVTFSVLGGCLGGFIRKDKKAEITNLTVEKEGPLAKCPACGQEFDSNPLLCSYCGAQIRTEKETA